MTGIVDAAERSAAVNPLASVCVSAPAGSGKTELLIQRYLRLLSRVQRPEQILAITFTRKAAAEMRERVIQALQAARDNTPCDSPHQRVTRALAARALSADHQHGWQLVENISRFNIKTIDSFCAGLTRQMPVLSQFGGAVAIHDDVSPLYAEAVQALYTLLDEEHPVARDLEALLLHFDNNWERLQALLVSMLARREQWRDYVGLHHAPQEAESYLMATVGTLVSDDLRALSQVLAPYSEELLALARFSAGNLGEPVPSQLPGTDAEDLASWQKLRALLVTKKGDWRRKITKSEGFPAGRGEAQQRKLQWQELLVQLQEIDTLQQRLNGLQSLPVIQADDVSWQLVLHLSRLLPILAAQLLLVFQQHAAVDHSQVAQSALLALGEDDAPTELALRLDYQIEHILVDEFQDTAITQYELLHKLTRGWGEHNELHPEAPRTLMIVGDGMQSIYGFRGANVGLFLRARQEGFNGVALQFLELRCNFRSDKGIVDWVNEAFTLAFPAADDVYRSQVRYSPATAVRPAQRSPAVTACAFHGDSAREREIVFIGEQLAACLDDGNETIAVLGRSRSHLQPVIKHLKQRGIPYNAPDLDSLAESPVVVDLLNLCRALASDADRLAWMALLRAPWCGLTLDDLLCVAVAGESPPYTPIWSAMQQADLHHNLSDDGRARLSSILPVLRQAREKRDRLGLRAWIEQAWLGLGGPQCAPAVESLHDVESFLQLLEQAEAEGAGLDFEWLQRRLQKCFMNTGSAGGAVQLLTLHKAKGLEFDRVIIPQLDRAPRSDGRDILLWDEHSSAGGVRSFLLAADDHSAADSPTLYNYLRLQRRQKQQLEATRLLYVGATRAVRQLVLTASVSLDATSGLPRAPSSQCLLHPVWQTFCRQMTLVDPLPLPPSAVAVQAARPLLRLSRSSQAEPPAAQAQAQEAVGQPPPPAINNRERITGRVVHRALEELALMRALPTAAGTTERRRWRMALQREGLYGAALETALATVLQCVDMALQAGSSGRWVLDSGHVEAHCEWPLTTVDSTGSIRDIVIDRCFIDRATGLRWVIDYKSSRPAEGESFEDFATRESALYAGQLQVYRDAVRCLGNQPVRCALFFTALGRLYIVNTLDLPELKPGEK
ncbi:MAG: UvrD-helicase domain-containing protein [Halioglobus sp.]|nr:UvrD-helicase domain-containing protein [Halioglobus sp.]